MRKQFSTFFILMALTSSAQIKIGVMGTSIDKGNQYPLTDSWPYRFGQMLGSGYQVDNYAVNGGSYTNVSVPLQNYVKKAQVQGHDIWVFGGPTNDSNLLFAAADSQFKPRYQRWVDSIKKWQPGIRIICNLAIHSKHSYLSDARIDKFNKWVREVAEENGLTVWPFSDLPVGFAAIQGQVQLLNDALHPTVFGYGTMANFALRQFLAEGRYKQDVPVIGPVQWVRIMPGVWLEICGNKRRLVRED